MSERDATARPISTVLTELSSRNGEGQDVHLGDVTALIGSRGHGAAILLLALPEMIPAPLPGLSAILGIPLFLVSLHLTILGESNRLPSRVESWPVPGRMLTALADYGAPILLRAERWTAPRMLNLVHRERMIGAVCAFWSIVLWLPIPFLNFAPSVVLILLAWGLVQRDGLFVLSGLIASILLIGITLLLGEVAIDLLRQVGWPITPSTP